MKAGKIVFRAFLILIIGVTVGMAVYTWNAKRVFHNEMPMPFGIGSSVVLSPSMEPTLHVNDLVFIKKATTFDVKDIVVYQAGSTLVIHRIIEKNDENRTVITKGDNNDADDGEIPLESIKGKMAFRIPYAGVVFKALKSLPGTIIILALAAFLMIMSWRNEKKESESEIDRLRLEIAKLKAGSDDETPESIEEEIAKLKKELGQTD
ncbi:MAG: signal peptidase I [Clostridia bacterium]|nr:signal peptidase I [Clostridia bacterium]